MPLKELVANGVQTNNFAAVKIMEIGRAPVILLFVLQTTRRNVLFVERIRLLLFIVAVHHYDENHSNNDPKNLVPLCPTHHQYLHSRYAGLIKDKVNDYVNNFREVGKRLATPFGAEAASEFDSHLPDQI